MALSKTPGVMVAQDQGVAGASLADGAVTTAKLADGALSADTTGRAKMADGFMNTAKLANGALSADATGRAKMADEFVTPAKMSQKMTFATSVATTSGTAIDFTSIPSWVKRITVAYQGVSLSGSSHAIVQLGAGSNQTSGYTATSAYCASSNQAGVASASNGLLTHGGSLSNAFTGTMTLVNITGNTWVASHSGMLNSTVGVTGGGSVTLSGTLDRLRLATANGTDTFDAGAVNILYEG